VGVGVGVGAKIFYFGSSRQPTKHKHAPHSEQ